MKERGETRKELEGQRAEVSAAEEQDRGNWRERGLWSQSGKLCVYDTR